MAGPLSGIRVVEMAGIGPGPFGAMMLADMGADIIRVDRPEAARSTPRTGPRFDVLNRGRRNVAIDAKHPLGQAAIKRLVKQADVLIEGFRPGVMERLGLGPDVLMADQPRLVYARMTGFGQTGPMSQEAGHDINYISMSGALNCIGEAGRRPIPPLSLVGDFGGGGMFLAFGVLCALMERVSSGKGQIVDAAMIDGSATLMAITYAIHSIGYWQDRRGTNVLDGGAPFYNTYLTKDGKYVAIAAVEPQFYRALLSALNLDEKSLPAQMDRTSWSELQARFAAIFLTRTRDEWCEHMANRDACFSPVLNLSEVPQSAQAMARSAFRSVDGIQQPCPAPRFSRTPGELGLPPAFPGENTRDAMPAWGFSADEIEQLISQGAAA